MLIMALYTSTNMKNRVAAGSKTCSCINTEGHETQTTLPLGLTRIISLASVNAVSSVYQNCLKKKKEGEIVTDVKRLYLEQLRQRSPTSSYESCQSSANTSILVGSSTSSLALAASRSAKNFYPQPFYQSEQLSLVAKKQQITGEYSRM